MGPIWGIDLGGTKIEGVVLESAASMSVLRRMRIPTEIDKGYYHVLGQIHKLVEVLSAEVSVRPASIGIGLPGALDPITRTLKSSGWEALDGKPIQSDLETYLGVPVRVANDANCFALAETRYGSVPEVLPTAKCVVGVILGTGVGAGIVFNGRVYPGRQGIAGEWGHNFLDESGGRCTCGRYGCAETVISGPALERHYEQLSGRHLPLADIAAAAELGRDQAAAQTIERLVYNFAKAVGAVINLLDPDAIIIGGGVGKIEALHTQGPDLIKRFVYNTRLDTLILKPKLGDSAGVFGAALL